MKTIYLVESVGYAPGRVYAIFSSREDAQMHCDSVEGDEAVVVERTLFTGQADNPGFNR